MALVGRARIGRGRKGETFEGKYVPFVAHWPRWLKLAISDELVMGSDLLPTLLEERCVVAPDDRSQLAVDQPNLARWAEPA